MKLTMIQLSFFEQEIKETESILIIKQNDGSETQSLKTSIE